MLGPSTLTDSTRPPCLEVEKHALRRLGASALPSDKPGDLPPENGFPLNNVRVRGQTVTQTDPNTQHNRDGAPLRNGTRLWPCHMRRKIPGGQELSLGSRRCAYRPSVTSCLSIKLLSLSRRAHLKGTARGRRWTTAPEDPTLSGAARRRNGTAQGSRLERVNSEDWQDRAREGRHGSQATDESPHT